MLADFIVTEPHDALHIALTVLVVLLCVYVARLIYRS